MRLITGDTFAEVYEKLLREVYEKYDFESSPRGFKIREILNVNIQIKNPLSNSFANSFRNLPKKYLRGELLWYFRGQNDTKTIAEYSKFWEAISNPDGTANSAYGYLLFKKLAPSNLTQWQWAYESLIADKDSRQAIIHFNDSSHQWIGNKDFVCTLNGAFNIRDNKLHFTTMMRSNDAFFGTTYDIPFFTVLQQQMLRHLKLKYPELELGEYNHYIVSAHIYERDFENIDKMLNATFSNEELPILDVDLIDTCGNPQQAILEENDQYNFTKWVFNK